MKPMKNIILQYHFTRLFVCGFSLIFFIPGYLILLIIPGMTIINSGRILMNPAMTVAPFAWEMLLAASNLWTITYVQRKDNKLTRFKTIKYLKAPSMNLFCSFRNHIWTSSVSITGKYWEFFFSVYFVEAKSGSYQSSDYYLISAPIPDRTRGLTQQESRPRHIVIICFPQHPEGIFVR